MGFPPLLNLSTRLSTAALPGQTTKTALTEESMFQNMAYRPTVYRNWEKRIKNFWVAGVFLHAINATVFSEPINMITELTNFWIDTSSDRSEIK